MAINSNQKECNNKMKNYFFYEDCINTYFLKIKVNYFKYNSLNFYDIPINCGTKGFSENYK